MEFTKTQKSRYCENVTFFLQIKNSITRHQGLLYCKNYFYSRGEYSVTHADVLEVYVKEGLPFTWNLSLKSSADSYLCFHQAFLQSGSCFFSLCLSHSLALCTVFGAISSNTDKVLLINPSANVFVLEDFKFHHKNWLT